VSANKLRTSLITVTSAIAIIVLSLTGGVAAHADENRYYGARSCEGNVASYMRTNASNWVDVYKVGGGVASQDSYQFDTVWRARTFYSLVKRSSSQYQHTESIFSSARIFCDN